MRYEFLDRTPEALIETSELPVADGIAVAVLTTGYEVGTDEAVELSIVDFAGNELFHQRVKPQNIEEWTGEASGGILPADVEEAPELYQFEEEISDLFENASIVIGEHIDFTCNIIEASWVTLPKHKEFDLTQEFCATHCTTDYPGHPAAIASLGSIAEYYGIANDESTSTAQANAAVACYLKLVAEHVDERAAKSDEYWAEYERQRAEAERNDVRLQEKNRIAEIKTLRINALLWLCAAAIFGNLSVQIYIRSYNMEFTVITAAAAIFFAIRWILCLYRMAKLRK